MDSPTPVTTPTPTGSLAWLRFTTALGVAWLYVKKYWFLVVGSGMVFFFVAFTRNKDDQIAALLKSQQDMAHRHEEEVANLQRIRDEEVRKRGEIERAYQTTIDRINRERDVAMQRLASLKETEIRQIIAETYDNPDAMAARINVFLGIPVVGGSTTP